MQASLALQLWSALILFAPRVLCGPSGESGQQGKWDTDLGLCNFIRKEQLLISLLKERRLFSSIFFFFKTWFFSVVSPGCPGLAL